MFLATKCSGLVSVNLASPAAHQGEKSERAGWGEPPGGRAGRARNSGPIAYRASMRIGGRRGSPVKGRLGANRGTSVRPSSLVGPGMCRYNEGASHKCQWARRPESHRSTPPCSPCSGHPGSLEPSSQPAVLEPRVAQRAAADFPPWSAVWTAY